MVVVDVVVVYVVAVDVAVDVAVVNVVAVDVKVHGCSGGGHCGERCYGVGCGNVLNNTVVVNLVIS